jgi:hypothetical protein
MHLCMLRETIWGRCVLVVLSVMAMWKVALEVIGDLPSSNELKGVQRRKYAGFSIWKAGYETGFMDLLFKVARWNY